ncbi:MAG: mycofactocin biosynthesis glycosyltransferase MftF [Candidatus Competibacteraceae bacterium]|nr:mycofactocin biosynthesis glycosyltransferase MftF [Candidatus Competibacteraceae bacterium]
MTLALAPDLTTVERCHEAEMRAGVPAVVRVDQSARYVLQPNLSIIADARGGVLLCLKPLLALRLNRQATVLLTALQQPCGIAELTARIGFGMTPSAIRDFLNSLLRRRLLIWQPAIPTVWPTVSIIVPARGRAAATRRCVQSLLALDYPAERREIIVVDDASEPPLAPVLADLPITLLRRDRNIGQSAARNLAASAATGTVLAFTDNDCSVEPGWLRALVPYLTEPDIAIVGGRIVAQAHQGAVAAFEAVRSPLDMGAAATEVTPAAAVSYLPTCNLLVRRDVLLAQGGFDAGLRVGEDVDFIWRVLDAGFRAWYAPTGRIAHDHRVRWGEWLRRRAEYGASEAMLQQRHPQGRRVMPIPINGLLLLLAVALLPRLGLMVWPLIGVGVLFGAELIEKQRKLRTLAVTMPASQIALALIREHAAGFYHLSANMARYYSLPLLGLGLLWPALLPALVLLLAVAPLTDTQRPRPQLSRPAFVGLYWLELAAYQAGVWRGCWRWRTLRPLRPLARWRR